MPDLGRLLFRIRSYTPLPFLVLLLLFAHPSLLSYLVGLGFVLLGEMIRIWAVGYAGEESRSTEIGASTLVTAGPFAYVRNPIYGGNFILCLGFFISAWSLMPYFLIIFLIGFFLQYSLIIKEEEEYLKLRFVEAYLSYRAEVPLIIPRLTSYPKTSFHTFSFKRALRSERRTLQSIFLVLLVIALRGWWRSL